MAKQTVNVGTGPDAGNGDPLRSAFQKLNSNSDELYSAVGSMDADLVKFVVAAQQPAVDGTRSVLWIDLTNQVTPARLWDKTQWVTLPFELADTTPDAYSFPPVIGSEQNTPVVSAPITPAGFNSVAHITVAGGDYRINGGSWTSAAGYFRPGDTVELRVQSSALEGTQVGVDVTIGGVGATFSVTTATTATAPTRVTKLGLMGVSRAA